jgi:hypothetical protein
MQRMPTKTVTVRLPASLVQGIETLARIEGVPFVQEVRQGLESHLKDRLREGDFLGKFREAQAREAASVSRLVEQLIPDA